MLWNGRHVVDIFMVGGDLGRRNGGNAGGPSRRSLYVVLAAEAAVAI